MTISKIFLFNCFFRPKPPATPTAAPFRLSQFLSQNPLPKDASFNTADRAWIYLTDGQAGRFDPTRSSAIGHRVMGFFQAVRTACKTGKDEIQPSLERLQGLDRSCLKAILARSLREAQNSLDKSPQNYTLVSHLKTELRKLKELPALPPAKIINLLMKQDGILFPKLTQTARSIGQTALRIACYTRQEKIVKILLSTGADVNSADSGGYTLLHWACRQGHVEIAKGLIEKGANPSARTRNGDTPLSESCRYAHLEVVQLLLNAGAEVNTADNNRCTPLHLACWKGHIEIAKQLIEKGADTSARKINGDTPLSNACFYGHIEVVQLLLNAGVEVDPADIYGWTPLHTACSRGHVEIAKRLIEKGANPSACTLKRRTPLEIACLEGLLEVVQLLLNAGVEVDPADIDGWTPLHTACSKGHVEIAKRLIEKGANRFAKNRLKRTPIDLGENIGLFRILTRTEKINIFDRCKDKHELLAILFPPSTGSLPPNWEELARKIPKPAGLIGLEEEENRLRMMGKTLPLEDEILKKLACISKASLPIDKILQTLLKIHPLFAKAWELAGQPAIQDEYNPVIRVNTEGYAACYNSRTHTIKIEKSRSNQRKLEAFLFETINAIQRDSFERSDKMIDLSREEYAFLIESIENNSSYWRIKLLWDSNCNAEDLQNSWIYTNIPCKIGLISHTDDIRRTWDNFKFSRWLEHHPEEFKRRLAELEAGSANRAVL